MLTEKSLLQMKCKPKILITENIKDFIIIFTEWIMSNVLPNSILDHYSAHINANAVAEGILCFFDLDRFGDVLSC